MATASRARRSRSLSFRGQQRWPSGGAVTSIPGASPLRIEISKTSNLPAQLIDAGYAVHQAGRVTRIGGGPKDVFMEADVIEVRSAKGVPDSDAGKKRRAELWNVLNKYVIANGAGAAITSVVGVWPLRLEVRLGVAGTALRSRLQCVSGRPDHARRERSKESVRGA